VLAPAVALGDEREFETYFDGFEATAR